MAIEYIPFVKVLLDLLQRGLKFAARLRLAWIARKLPMPGFDARFPEIAWLQERVDDLRDEPKRQDCYFSSSPSSSVTHLAVQFRQGSKPVDFESIVDLLRDVKGAAEIVICTAFPGDVLETLWALAHRVQEKRIVWVSGRRIIDAVRFTGSLTDQPSELVARVLLGQQHTEGLNAIFRRRPSLFIFDLSDLRPSDVLEPDGELIMRACSVVRDFTNAATARNHATLIGFPRFVRANEPAADLLQGSNPIFESDELFAAGFEYRARHLQDILGAAPPDPLALLLACNSNTLLHTMLAFLLRRRNQGHTITNADFKDLASALWDLGLHEIAYRLVIYLDLHERTPADELLEVTFVVQRERHANIQRVSGIVGSAEHLPRAVARATLVAEPGGGKTVTLREIERRWILPEVPDEGERKVAWLPIYCDVSEHSGDLWQRITDSLQRRLTAGGPGTLGWSELKRWSEEGRLGDFFASPLMLLVDGLDEIQPKEGDRLVSRAESSFDFMGGVCHHSAWREQQRDCRFRRRIRRSLKGGFARERRRGVTLCAPGLFLGAQMGQRPRPCPSRWGSPRRRFTSGGGATTQRAWRG